MNCLFCREWCTGHPGHEDEEEATPTSIILALAGDVIWTQFCYSLEHTMNWLTPLMLLRSFLYKLDCQEDVKLIEDWVQNDKIKNQPKGFDYLTYLYNHFWSHRFLRTALLRSNFSNHKIHSLKVYNPMIFNQFTVVWPSQQSNF